MRGIVLPLTRKEILQRMRYLAGLATLATLDKFVNKSGDLLASCPTIYYLLKDYNGGTNPLAPDPATRWSKPGSDFVNITCDCIGGMAWCGGFDRLQIHRFPFYDGYINTDSIFDDIRANQVCFVRLDLPESGCFVVCETGSPGHEKCGHIQGVLEVPVEWDATKRECWEALKLVDVAARGEGVRANRITNGVGAFHGNGIFVKSVMKP